MPVLSRNVIPGEGRQHRQCALTEPQDVESRSSIACAGWMLEGELVSMYIRIWMHACVYFVFPLPAVGVTLPYQYLLGPSPPTSRREKELEWRLRALALSPMTFQSPPVLRMQMDTYRSEASSWALPAPSHGPSLPTAPKSLFLQGFYNLSCQFPCVLPHSSRISRTGAHTPSGPTSPLTTLCPCSLGQQCGTSLSRVPACGGFSLPKRVARMFLHCAI